VPRRRGETSGASAGVSPRFTAPVAPSRSARSRGGIALEEVVGMMFLALALALLIGVSLGLLGGGGSILTLPILTYAIGMETKEAIAASLFVVGVTSATGAIAHARAGRIRWRTGLLFGGAGMVGAFLGGRIAAYVPGSVLMLLFTGMMIATSIAMLRGRRGTAAAALGASHDLAVGKVLIEGGIVGIVTGMVGAGGGFLVVPALVLLGGLPMELAIGTSLVVIAMKSFAGLAGHLGHVDVDWPITLAVTAAAVLGSFAGGRLAGRIPGEVLRRGFGIFVLLMAGFVIVKELGLI
jgi:uncharacterized protein